MSKKNKDKDEDEDLIETQEEYTPKSKGKGCLIGVGLTALIVAFLIAILVFNVGNIRDKYLRTGLEKIPIIKNLLPPLEEEEILEEEGNIEEKISEELRLEIEELNAEIERLKEFEKIQLEFKAQKEEFDTMIALNDPKAYALFYEEINPENAEELYKQAIVQNVTDKKFKEYIKTFENMKKDAASKILEELITTDMDLVITILENITSEKRSEILSVMQPKNAASCTKLLSPK